MVLCFRKTFARVKVLITKNRRPSTENGGTPTDRGKMEEVFPIFMSWG